MEDEPKIVKPMSYSKQRKSVGEIVKQEKEQSKIITRTTVINPRQIEWPDNIDESSLTELRSTLKEAMSALKWPNSKVSLNEIRKVDKACRKEFREQWRAKQAVEFGFDVQNYVQLRSNLAIGVNCVSRALDLNELAGVIIEKDVSPSIITKLLVPTALAKDVPIIAITGLKETFETNTRMRCIAVGFKKSCTLISNHFHALLNLVKLYGKQYLEETPSTATAQAEAKASTLENIQNTPEGPPEKKAPKRKALRKSFKSPKVRKTQITIKAKAAKKKKPK